MSIKQSIYAALMPAIRLYWRIVKPRSFGVKVLITHPTDTSKVLLVRHAYGDTTLWNIPGGGYNPTQERAGDAALREIREELGVQVLDLQPLGEYITSGEGKRDTVTLFRGTIAPGSSIQSNSEISGLEWAEGSQLGVRGNDVARVARRAAALAFPGSTSP